MPVFSLYIQNAFLLIKHLLFFRFRVCFLAAYGYVRERGIRRQGR